MVVVETDDFRGDLEEVQSLCKTPNNLSKLLGPVWRPNMWWFSRVDNFHFWELSLMPQSTSVRGYLLKSVSWVGDIVSFATPQRP
jgi:hypothetical protein